MEGRLRRSSEAPAQLERNDVARADADAWRWLQCEQVAALLVWRTAGETAARWGRVSAGLQTVGLQGSGWRVKPSTPGLERYVTIQSNTVSMETQCHAGKPECANGTVIVKTTAHLALALSEKPRGPQCTAHHRLWRGGTREARAHALSKGVDGKAVPQRREGRTMGCEIKTF